ncbi:hypothetical protein ACEQUB_02453 [Ralstonia syzygii]
MACAAPGHRQAHPHLGNQRRPHRQAAQGHHACRTRHPGRPARLAPGRSHQARRPRDRATAALDVRHPGHPGLPAQAGRREAGPPRRGQGGRGRHARGHAHAGGGAAAALRAGPADPDPRLPARHPELRAARRARPDAVGRGPVARGQGCGAVAWHPRLAGGAGRAGLARAGRRHEKARRHGPGCFAECAALRFPGCRSGASCRAWRRSAPPAVRRRRCSRASAAAGRSGGARPRSRAASRARAGVPAPSP